MLCPITCIYKICRVVGLKTNISESIKVQKDRMTSFAIVKPLYSHLSHLLVGIKEPIVKKRTFKQWLSTIPPISIKRTITEHKKKNTPYNVGHVYVLDWDRHKHVAGFKHVMVSQPSSPLITVLLTKNILNTLVFRNSYSIVVHKY